MPDTSMQFAHSNADTELDVHTHQQGSVTFTVNQMYDGKAVAGFSYRLTLGQNIQLRDFLNRHIDHFALGAVGSLAVRATDDLTQLASVETIDLSRVMPCAVAEPVLFTGADGINLHD